MTYGSVFAGLVVLSFGLFILLSGLFTAYFGAGKSRKIGLGLTLVGLVSLAFFVSATWPLLPGFTMNFWTPQDAAVGIVAVLAASLGAIVALGLFLVSIMKA